jgi:hypothetical protein
MLDMYVTCAVQAKRASGKNGTLLSNCLRMYYSQVELSCAEQEFMEPEYYSARASMC